MTAVVLVTGLILFGLGVVVGWYLYDIRVNDYDEKITKALKKRYGGDK